MKVKHFKNLPFVDLQPKGGKLPLNGDIYIAIYDADFGAKVIQLQLLPPLLFVPSCPRCS